MLLVKIRKGLLPATPQRPATHGWCVSCSLVLILGNCPTWRKNYFQCIYLFIVLYMFRACHAHHQEKQIVSIQLLVIVTPCWWQPAHDNQQLHLKYLCNLAKYWLQDPWGRHDSVETCRIVIICEIIVHLLVIAQNNNRFMVQLIEIMS